ncbi:MAG TPA: cytochrome c3 family protein [Candidatus Binatia bacterium]|nr:cytochrome c3 family protein [Candidatus Binatia bacterium]
MTRFVLPVVLLLLVAGGLTAALSQRPWSPRRDVVQPIAFSHRIHAGERHIPCEYCHEYARRSPTAGVPPVGRCVGCHEQMNEHGALPAVTQPWTDHRQPAFEIAWNRVYTLPDFVRFAHRPHVLAGVRCQECHGPVETMDRVEPVRDIDMGFCIGCHTARGVSKDCSLCHY